MRKINIAILIGFIIASFALSLSVSAQDGGSDTNVARNTRKNKKGREEVPKFGYLYIKTDPAQYPVFVNGQQVGMTTLKSDVSTTPANQQAIKLDNGTYDVEIHFPDKVYRMTRTVRGGKFDCICLNYSRAKVTRPCPYDVSVDAPRAIVDGTNVTFSAQNAVNVQGPPVKLNYRWTVTPENLPIREGQGTPTITVDSTGYAGKRISAVLEVDTGDADTTCRQRIPVAVDVEALPTPPPTEKFDDSPFVNTDAFKARLDNFATALQNRPDNQGYIITYSGNGRQAPQADYLGAKAIDYLTNNRKIDARRVVFVNGGKRPSTSFELFLVPNGANPPTPTPQR